MFLLFCHVPLTWSAWNISLVEHILPRHSHQVLMRCTVIGPKWRYLFLLVYVFFQMTTAVSLNILGLSESQAYDSLAASFKLLISFLFFLHLSLVHFLAYLSCPFASVTPPVGIIYLISYLKCFDVQMNKYCNIATFLGLINFASEAWEKKGKTD